MNMIGHRRWPAERPGRPHPRLGVPDEPRYARAARHVAESARALPPVDTAADLLAAIAGEGVTARGGEGASRVAA
jgi:hypothetical protein